VAIAFAGQEWPSAINFVALEPGDGPLLLGLFRKLSPMSRYYRFMSPIARPEQAHPEELLRLDHDQREAVVALWHGEAIGIARYSRRSPGSAVAEFAVVVADDWQRMGVATELLSRLANLALGHGVSEFTFTALTENHSILELVHKLVREPRITVSGPYLEGSVETLELGGYRSTTERSPVGARRGPN
jgi:GNAT superfamily N-acetyltransferase